MSLYAGCADNGAFSDVATSNCLESFGQPVRAFLQRTKNGTADNELTIADAKLLATFTALKAATDGTKIVITPEFGGATAEPGEPRTFGSGNEVPDGIPIPLGNNPSPFTANLIAPKASIVEQLKKLSGSKGVYLVDNMGRIAGQVDDHANPTKIKPFPIRSFFVSDKGFGGFDGADINRMSWQFPAGWSDKFFIVEPDFNPRTDLI